MFLFGILLSIIGNSVIGIGLSFQKYGLNQIPQEPILGKAGKASSRPSSRAEMLKKSIKTGRFGNKYWLIGIILAYLGELFGNV